MLTKKQKDEIVSKVEGLAVIKVRYYEAIALTENAVIAKVLEESKKVDITSYANVVEGLTLFNYKLKQQLKLNKGIIND